MHRPNDLRELREQLALIEERRRAALIATLQDHPGAGSAAAVDAAEGAELDREAGIFALTCVTDYLEKVAAETSALRRLLDAISDWSRSASWRDAWHSSTSANQSLQGKIAGIVHLRSLSAGTSARAAAEWVADNFPVGLHGQECSGDERRKVVSARTVYAWYSRWSGKEIPMGYGREGYELMMRAGLRTKRQDGRCVERLPSAELLRGALLGIALSKPSVISGH
jgi:hypothetical protein